MDNDNNISYRKVSSFRERFTTALKIREMTEAELAQRLEVPVSMIERFSASEKCEPDPAFILRIASALDVPSRWLSGYNVSLSITEESKGCDFCRNYDFSLACTETDHRGSRIRIAYGSSSYPVERRFRHCPDCGKALIHLAEPTAVNADN